MADITIYTDGAARGNPGPSASGFIVYLRGRMVKIGAHYNGRATNNFAEYTAVVKALEWCISNVRGYSAMSVELHSDSELVVRQLNGAYRVKAGSMKKLNSTVRELSARFREAAFRNLPREERHIAMVDSRINLLLDSVEEEHTKG